MFVCVLLPVLGASDTAAQINDLQRVIHEKARFNGSSNPKDEQWIKVQQALAGYSPEEIVRALIAEVDVDSGDDAINYVRDLSFSNLIAISRLPPTLICKELDKPQPPLRKGSLIRMLTGIKSDEVTQALLRQLKDRRYGAKMPGPINDGAKLRPLRVCDVAFNILAYSLGLQTPIVSMFLSATRRDQAIQEGLDNLHLKIPD